jgi:hypothetical protein
MNGVKTIVQAVPTFLPKLVPVGLLLLGLILGFVWAYGISPNVYTAAEPVNLGLSWKEEYIKQVAWQLQASGDRDNAARQLAALGNADVVLAEMMKTPAIQQDANLNPRLTALLELAKPDEKQLAKVSSSLLKADYTPILCVLGLALLAGGFVIFNTLIPISLLLSRAQTTGGTVVSGQEKERRQAIEAAKQQKTDFASTAPDRGKPVAQFISTYLLNDDVYDDSFSIETESGEFLGETGAGISKTIGTGVPKKVTAVEAWVFDKNDIKTVTKVFMSEYAFNNDAIRAELAARGEAVLAKPGLITNLETTTLTVQVRVVDMAYESGATGDGSFFSKITVELAAWPKKAPAAGIPDPYASTGKFSATPPPPPPGSPN